MSLFSDLVREASDQKNYTLSDVLLKAKVLAAQFKGRKFRQWVDHEINGYPRNGEIPDYRVLPTRVRGEFAGYSNSRANIELSLSHLPNEIRSMLTTYKEYNGISFVEDIIRPENRTIGRQLDGKMVNFFRQYGPFIDGMILNGLFAETSKHSCVQLLHNVRSRLLDFLLEIQGNYPDVATEDAATSSINEADVDATVQRKVYHDCTVFEGTNMGDVYQASQAGAMGPGATAQNMTFIQNLREAIGQSTLAELATELATLRASLLVESRTSEQDAAVASVAEAESAAKKGDAKGVLSYLKSAGTWAFDAAKKIGVAIAAKAIEKSMKF